MSNYLQRCILNSMRSKTKQRRRREPALYCFVSKKNNAIITVIKYVTVKVTEKFNKLLTSENRASSSEKTYDTFCKDSTSDYEDLFQYVVHNFSGYESLYMRLLNRKHRRHCKNTKIDYKPKRDNRYNSVSEGFCSMGERLDNRSKSQTVLMRIRSYFGDRSYSPSARILNYKLNYEMPLCRRTCQQPG